LRTRPGYWWVPIGAGLALFAMTGASRLTDYRAHLFGLAFGVLSGLGWAFAQRRGGYRPPGPAVQVLLGAVALGVVVSTWVLAFHHAGWLFALRAAG
jgi:hypothetical protein